MNIVEQALGKIKKVKKLAKLDAANEKQMPHDGIKTIYLYLLKYNQNLDKALLSNNKYYGLYILTRLKGFFAKYGL
jgi:hypothetical protein